MATRSSKSPAARRGALRGSKASAKGRSTPRKSGINLPKFASEVSRNFARGVSRATAGSSKPAKSGTNKSRTDPWRSGGTTKAAMDNAAKARAALKKAVR
jgi:hypothetical protein